MNAFKYANRFTQEDDGAVTVDWVVLTAAIVGLSIAVIAAVSPGFRTLGEKISDDLSSHESTVDTYTAPIVD